MAQATDDAGGAPCHARAPDSAEPALEHLLDLHEGTLDHLPEYPALSLRDLIDDLKD